MLIGKFLIIADFGIIMPATNIVVVIIQCFRNQRQNGSQKDDLQI